jgi:Tfp pilus assembly protein PilF
MTERATAIEPMNLDYWKQMAELYERAGQHDRAAAVKLQWLSPPTIK